MKKHLSKLLSFFLCMSFFVTISNKANAAEEIIPVNISVQYGQTEARTILDMINEMRTSDYDVGMKPIQKKKHIGEMLLLMIMIWRNLQ